MCGRRCWVIENPHKRHQTRVSQFDVPGWSLWTTPVPVLLLSSSRGSTNIMKIVILKESSSGTERRLSVNKMEGSEDKHEANAGDPSYLCCLSRTQNRTTELSPVPITITRHFVLLSAALFAYRRKFEIVFVDHHPEGAQEKETSKSVQIKQQRRKIRRGGKVSSF